MRFFALLLALLAPEFSEAMTFSPSVIDVQVEPGSSAEVALSVGNTETVENRYSVSIYAVNFDDETGEPAFASLSESVRSWVVVDDYEFTLVAGSSRSLAMNISPPANAPDDTYVIGVVVREAGINENLYLSTGFSSLVFVTVGAPEVHLEVQSVRGPGLQAHLPADMTYTIRNVGVRTGQPYGLVRIKNTFGAVVDEIELNPYYRRIPEGVSREFVVSWGENDQPTSIFDELWREVTNFRVGIFTAELVAAPYAGADVTLHATTRFLVLPWRVALFACALISTVLLVRRRGRKRW